MQDRRTAAGTEVEYLRDEQIEQVMEDELRNAGLLPSVETRAVELERFVEEYLNVKLDRHAPLDPQVLGETELAAGVRPKISMNRDLTDLAEDYGDLADVGRWRATLAHEASHVILHRMLVEFAADPGILFGKEPGVAHGMRLMRCLKRDMNAPRDRKEVQANKGMAALLMPRPVFQPAAEETLKMFGVERLQLDRMDRRAYAIACRLAEEFRTSREATLIRLETLRFLARVGERGLPLVG